MSIRKKRITIVIATHKAYQMPKDAMYLPLHVGAEGKKLDLGYVKDNTGENISLKNPSYCELTGLYWAWKNLDSDYIGLAHYRRHFMYQKKGKDPFENVLKESELQRLLSKYQVLYQSSEDIILKHYIPIMHIPIMQNIWTKQEKLSRNSIRNIFLLMIRLFSSTYGYMFNMMIMRRDLFCFYCEWLFTILFALEKQMENHTEELSAFQGRFYGRVSEIIFNAWLDYQIEKGKIDSSEIKELPCIYMEKIDWNRKISSFIRAKITHKKYDGSF